MEGNAQKTNVSNVSHAMCQYSTVLLKFCRLIVIVVIETIYLRDFIFQKWYTYAIRIISEDSHPHHFPTLVSPIP